MPPTLKKILILLGVLVFILLGGLIFLRPWWLGFEVVKRTGSLEDISFVERPLCKYWQGNFKTEESIRPAESFRFWVYPKQTDVIEKLERVSKSGEKIEIQYEKARARGFWACTPSEYRLISIEIVPPVAAPLPPK